ncbi:hypothetical protein CCYN2B_110149 [Capnocytophaga cynodegmi]|uniref:Uncharacterized protein n=1 Tax=Capnocytophaga cynodegmi TaxID=28189 RepID=A0A0B7GZP9_9FLAO|nr:hypothetical protein CCYN2B_110149 [Capnocytophaga cynodegmi]
MGKNIILLQSCDHNLLISGRLKGILNNNNPVENKIPIQKSATNGINQYFLFFEP